MLRQAGVPSDSTSPAAWVACRGSQKHFIPTWTMGSSESWGSPHALSCLLPPWQWEAVKEWTLLPFCIPIWLVELLALLLPFLLITLPVPQEWTFSEVMHFLKNCHGPRWHQGSTQGQLQQEQKNLICRKLNQMIQQLLRSLFRL